MFSHDGKKKADLNVAYSSTFCPSFFLGKTWVREAEQSIDWWQLCLGSRHEALSSNSYARTVHQFRLPNPSLSTRATRGEIFPSSKLWLQPTYHVDLPVLSSAPDTDRSCICLWNPELTAKMQFGGSMAASLSDQG